MGEVLHQLGGLLLGSVPTIILFLVVVLLYRFLVYGPLTRTLAERRAHTQGAIEQANSAAAAAQAKTQEYEARLRAARGEIFHARQQRLQELNRDRENALNDVRDIVSKRLEENSAALQEEMEAARHTIEGSADQLAGEILQAVLYRGLSVAGSSQ